jgi:hypothetical protein
LKVILKEYCFAAKVDWATSFCDCESVLLFSLYLSLLSLSFLSLSPASILFLFFDQKIQSSKACNGKERQQNWSVNLFYSWAGTIANK